MTCEENVFWLQLKEDCKENVVAILLLLFYVISCSLFIFILLRCVSMLSFRIIVNLCLPFNSIISVDFMAVVAVLCVHIVLD